MAFCTGNGNLDTDGCCWVAGEVCPLRWKIVDGRIKEGPDLFDRGTPAEFAASVSNNKQVQQRIIDQAAGITYACKAAVEVLVANSSLLTDRPGFNAAWNNHGEYLAKVRPHWEVIEDDLGLARGEYQCSTWKGTLGAQCCFAEPEAVNESKRQGLSASAVEIRQRGAL